MFSARALAGKKILITGGAYLISEYGFINGDCVTMDGGAGLVEGGGGTVRYLHSWGPEQWEEFCARAAGTVAS